MVICHWSFDFWQMRVKQCRLKQHLKGGNFAGFMPFPSKKRAKLLLFYQIRKFFAIFFGRMQFFLYFCTFVRYRVPENFNFWGERRHKLLLRFSGAVSSLHACCRTRPQRYKKKLTQPNFCATFYTFMWIFCQNMPKIDTIKVVNIKTGICLSSFSVWVQTYHRCHAQTGMMSSVHRCPKAAKSARLPTISRV